jgi:hypothetical protein
LSTDVLSLIPKIFGSKSFKTSQMLASQIYIMTSSVGWEWDNNPATDDTPGLPTDQTGI